MSRLLLLDGPSWDGTPLTPGRGTALLAALAGAWPRSVGVAALVDAVWPGPDERPAHPEKALQVQVSRVRTQTAPGTVERLGGGYRLGLRDEDVDLLLLRRLVEEATRARWAGDLDLAGVQARRATTLSLTTADTDGPTGDLVAEARDLQRRARGLLGSVLLARGDAAEALDLLERGWTDAPGEAPDETRLGELLRAEAQVRGVPAALARYASYAAATRERLGAEPGEALRALHAELLARDAPVRHGLRHATTPLLGRDDDVATLRGLLATSRLVTVLGAGGLGKTRLVQLLARAAEQPGVHVVELAGVTSAEGVLPEVAAALGVRESQAAVRTGTTRGDLQGRVLEQLAGTPTLLVLDNCEHLVESVAGLVGVLLATTPALTVLTTSRAPLGLAAEQVYALPSLTADDAAVLFAQRARAARRDVVLRDDEVAAVVARLDGLPLAVELAAARTRAMSVAQVGARLADGLGVLAGRDRSAPERHRTLEAVIRWSWDLLEEPSREAMRRLAVFPDGFGVEGAAAVLGADPVGELTDLVDQSLLVVREGETLRYRFLETVREFGLRRLADVDGLASAEAALRDWAVATARTEGVRLFSPDQVQAMVELRAEAGNLAAVMRAALAAGDAAGVVPLVGTLVALATVRGEHVSALELAEEASAVVLDAPADTPERTRELRAVLAAVVLGVSILQDDPPPAPLARLAELGLAGDGGGVDALVRVVTAMHPSPAAGDDAPLATLEALCEDPDPRVARLALQWVTQWHENAGELVSARAAARRALALCDDRDGPWTRAMVESQLSGLATQCGDWADTVGHTRAALEVMDRLGADADVAQLLGTLAFAAVVAGDLDEAERLVREVERRDVGSASAGWSVTDTCRAELALARGEVEEGLARHLEVLARARERESRAVASEVLPWVLYAQSTVLLVHALAGRAEVVDDEERRAQQVVLDLLADPTGARRRVDLPMLGGVSLGLGCLHLALGGPAPTEACRLVALGHRLGYHRHLPSRSWEGVRDWVGQRAPGVLDPLVAAYADRRATDLLDDLRAAVEATRRP